MKGRPKGTLKYIHPLTNERIGVYEFRKYVNFINKFFKGDLINNYKNIHNKKNGRPFNTFKYRDKNYNPISVYEWRKQNRKEFNLKYRKKRTLNRYKKEALKYGLTLQEYLDIKKKCYGCGFNKYPCDIHHIDGNNKNNNKENLIGLCPTCHFGIERGYIILNQDRTLTYYNTT